MATSQILTKSEMTEEDIKYHYITPAIEAKWDKSLILFERKITDGKINIMGNKTVREDAKKADYMLYMNPQFPLAVVEAKSNKFTISHGLQQAKQYAEMMNIPFAYSSNGDGFEEYDYLTGQERTLKLEDFPSLEELRDRYLHNCNDGNGITAEENLLIEQPYYTDQNTYDPRYYQANAINLTLKAITKHQKRMLLVMATGTGKTYTAFQIVYRLIKSGLVKKVLYLADRNILVDQSIQQDFKSLQKVTHKVQYSEDIKKGKSTYSAYQVYFALYQQLIGEGGEAHYAELFDPDYFDLIIVDECHRGSAKDDSQWRCVLEYFNNAYQLGMTATPKETSYVSNLSYFGEPLYQYSLKQGIEDGFLAPFKVIKVTTNISEGWRPTKGQCDIYGNEIEDRVYTNSDFDYKIIIQDRINQVAQEITNYLKATDRMSKTIVFCANEEHANMMRKALNNLNSDITKEHPDYVVRITASDDYGKKKLDYFISVNAEYPVIATTSDLLSTGADCKMTKLIVLDKMIGSMTQFKQIIGRGTRIREKEGKMSFAVMDFRNVSRLFADPNWDGPIEIDPNYPPTPGTKPVILPPNPPDPILTPPKNLKPIVTPQGCRVEIINKMVSVYDVNGKLLKHESIIDYTKSNVIGEYASLDAFIQNWNKADKKTVIKEQFAKLGIDFEEIKKEKNMSDVDDFDFICYIAFNQKPLTRRERADNVKKRDIFEKYGEAAREVINALLDKYAELGIYDIESTEILKQNPFTKYGKPARIAALFGGSDKYRTAIRELENELYKVA